MTSIKIKRKKKNEEGGRRRRRRRRRRRMGSAQEEPQIVMQSWKKTANTIGSYIEILSIETSHTG